MAKLEIDLAPDEQARLVQEAQRAGLSVDAWARERLLGKPVVTFTAEDGGVYEIPNLPADKY